MGGARAPSRLIRLAGEISAAQRTMPAGNSSSVRMIDRPSRRRALFEHCRNSLR
jgi:hypothetical protein